MTEKELENLAKEESKVNMEDWAKFRERLIGLTDVTKSHFEKLVQVGHLLCSPFKASNQENICSLCLGYSHKPCPLSYSDATSDEIAEHPK